MTARDLRDSACARLVVLPCATGSSREVHGDANVLSFESAQASFILNLKMKKVTLPHSKQILLGFTSILLIIALPNCIVQVNPTVTLPDAAAYCRLLQNVHRGIANCIHRKTAEKPMKANENGPVPHTAALVVSCGHEGLQDSIANTWRYYTKF